MIKNKNKLRIPPQHRRYQIDPDVRVKVFKEIAAKYKFFYVINFIFDLLNNYKIFLFFFGLIFKGRNDYDTHDIILYDMVPINGDRCTPEYIYYKNAGKEKNFFQFGAEEMVIMSPHRFYEYLEMLCGLSRDKNTDEFWKNPKNAKKLTDNLLELALGYNRKKPAPDDL